MLFFNYTRKITKVACLNRLRFLILLPLLATFLLTNRICYAKHNLRDNYGLMGLGVYREAFVPGSGIYDSDIGLYAPYSIFGTVGWREVATSNIMDLNFSSSFKRAMEAAGVSTNKDGTFSFPFITINIGKLDKSNQSIESSILSEHLYAIVIKESLIELQGIQDNLATALKTFEHYKGNPLAFYHGFGDGYLHYGHGIMMIVIQMDLHFSNQTAHHEFTNQFSIGGGLEEQVATFSLNQIGNYLNSMEGKSEEQSAAGEINIKVNIIGVPKKQPQPSYLRGMLGAHYNGKGLTESNYNCPLNNIQQTCGSLLESLYAIKYWIGDYDPIIFPASKGTVIGSVQLNEEPIILYKNSLVLGKEFKDAKLDLSSPSAAQAEIARQISNKLRYVEQESNYLQRLISWLQAIIAQDLTPETRTPAVVYLNYLKAIAEKIDLKLPSIVHICAVDNMVGKEFDFRKCEKSLDQYQDQLNQDKATIKNFWLKNYPDNYYWVSIQYNRNPFLLSPENMFCLHDSHQKTLTCQVIGKIWPWIPEEKQKIIFQNVANGDIDTIGRTLESMPYFFVSDRGADAITVRDLYLKLQVGKKIRDCRYSGNSLHYMGVGTLLLTQWNQQTLDSSKLIGDGCENLKENFTFVGYGLTPDMANSKLLQQAPLPEKVNWFAGSMPIDDLQVKIHSIDADSHIMFSNLINFSPMVYPRINGNYMFNNLQQQVDEQLATMDPFKTKGEIEFNIKDINGNSHHFATNLFADMHPKWSSMLGGIDKVMPSTDLIPVVDDLDLAKKNNCDDISISGNYTDSYLVRLTCNGKPQYLSIKDSAPWGTVLINPANPGEEILQHKPLRYYPHEPKQAD